MALSDLKEIIKEAPLSQIIGNFIPLKIKGNIIEGLCPFHPDHHPSLKVNDQKKLFMCFACQTGGDAITFVQKFRNIGFLDALKEISTILSLDFNSFQENRKFSPELEMAKKLISRAVKIYIKSKNSVFDSFLKDRLLTPEVVEKFQIGYAPDNNVFYNYLLTIKDLQERDFALKIALKIGLLKRGDNYFDTFRKRVMFPIWDRSGNMVGFTSRALFEYQKAKYMNSPTSLIFDKKNILYGLHLASSAIRAKKQIILCEGNMDLISLHKNNFDNSIAIMGLGLSEKSILLLKDMAQEFYLALDSDEAGKSAAERLNLDLMNHGIVAKYLDFSPQKDPDEFLKNNGPLQFAALLDNAPTFIDSKLDNLVQQNISPGPDKKLQLLNQVFELLSPLGLNLSAIERLAQLIPKIGLKSSIEDIKKAYQNFLKSNPQGQISSQTLELPKKREYPKPTPSIKLKKISRGEKHLILEIIQNPEYLINDGMQEILDLLPDSEVKLVVSKLKNLYLEVDEISFYEKARDLLSSDNISLELKEAVGLAFFRPRLLEADSRKKEKIKDRVFKDLICTLREDLLIREKEFSKDKLKECFNLNESRNLMIRIFEIEKELDKIKLER